MAAQSASATLCRASDPTEPAQAHCQTPCPASLDRQLTAVDQTVGAQQARHPLHRLQTRITLHMAVLCNASASHTHHVQTGGSRHSQGTGSTHRLLSKSFRYACALPAASAARRCRAASRGGASPAASASAATRAPSVSEAGPAVETSKASQCCPAGLRLMLRILLLRQRLAFLCAAAALAALSPVAGATPVCRAKQHW